MWLSLKMEDFVSHRLEGQVKKKKKRFPDTLALKMPIQLKGKGEGENSYWVKDIDACSFLKVDASE